MTIKWADVLNALRKDHGFTGEDDLATVKAFVSEKSIELTDEAEAVLEHEQPPVGMGFRNLELREAVR